MTDQRRPDEGPLAPRRTLEGGRQSQQSNDPGEPTQYWSAASRREWSAASRTQTQDQPTQSRYTVRDPEPSAESGTASGSSSTGEARRTSADSEKTSPLAMAAAAVAAAKDRMSPTRLEHSETTTRPSRPSTYDYARSSPSAASNRIRRARLRMVRIDPWSVMKTAFLLSIAFGIMCVVAVFIIWSVLGAADVFTSVNQSVESVIDQNFSVENYIGMDRVLSFTMLVAVLNVVLLTAVATLGAFLYNLAASLLGGLEVTLAEDDH